MIGAHACIPPWRRLTLRDAGELTFATLAADAGASDVAGAVVERWERRIGVTRFDRMDPGQKAARLADRRRERLIQGEAMRQSRQKALDTIMPPKPDKEAARILREAQEARLQAAQAAEASRRLKEGGMQRQADKAQDQAEAGIREAERLERLAGDRMDRERQKAWSAGVLSERADLSALRGEAVVETVTDIADWVRDDQGVVIRDRRGIPVLGHDKAATRRVESSRGLMRAYESGDLQVPKGVPAEQLWFTGTRYRDAYEVAACLLTPAIEPGQPAARASGPSTGINDRLIESFTLLRKMRGQPIRFDDHGAPISDHALVPMTELQIKVIDAVCGQDCTIRATARIVKRRHAAVKTALVEALTIAKANLDP